MKCLNSKLSLLQFIDGYGTKKDKARALSYFQLAAHGGHLHAIFNLGEINAEGKVVKRNCNFAVEVSLLDVIFVGTCSLPHVLLIIISIYYKKSFSVRQNFLYNIFLA